MAGIWSILNDPKRQGFLFISLVLVVYLYLARPVNFTTDMVVQGGYAYLALGGEGIRVIDVSNPDNVSEVGYYNTAGIVNGIEIRDNLAYIADGKAGLRILDVSDPSNIQEVGIYNTRGNAEDVAVVGKYAYIADGKNGLQVINIEDKINPELLFSFKLRGSIHRIDVAGEYAFLADNRKGFIVVDISKPNNPNEIGYYRANSSIRDIQIVGKYAFLAADRRGLIVLDITDPTNLIEAGVFATSGDAVGVSVVDIYAYIAEGRNGFRVVDLFPLTDMKEIGRYDTPGNLTNIVVIDEYAYLADGYDGLRVVQTPVLITPKVVGKSSPQANAEDVAVSGNYAYLAAGERGLRIVDITDPQSPFEVNFFDTPGYSMAVAVEGVLAYIADRNEGLRVIDVTNPAGTLVETSVFNLSRDANDIVKAGDYVYLAEGNVGINIFDFSNPSLPIVIGYFDTPGYAVSAATYGDYLYIADSGAGLRVINVSDPTVPTEMGFYDTPGDARAVSIGVSRKSAEERTEDSNLNIGTIIAYVADGSQGLRVVEVTNPRALKEIGYLETPDFVQDVAKDGDILYLAGREDGLIIVDISEPDRPIEIGRYDTPGKAHGVSVAGQYAYVADYERGLRIVDISNAEEPVEVGFYDAPATVIALAVKDDYVYVADGDQGLRVLDVSDVRTPKEVGFYSTPGNPNHVSVFGDYVFIADGNAGLHLVDISIPQKPVKAGDFDTPGNAMDVSLYGEYALVADGESGLQILNVSNPFSITKASSLDTPGIARGVATASNYIYIADGPAGLQIIKLTDPRSPEKISVYDELSDVRDVVVVNNLAYLAAGEDGFRVLDVSRPLIPVEVASVAISGSVVDIQVSGMYAFLANGLGGLQVIDISDPTHPISVGSDVSVGNSLGLNVISIPPMGDRPGGFRIFLANDSQGIRVLDAYKSISPRETGFYETPGTATYEQVLRWVLAKLTGDSGVASKNVGKTILQFLYDFLVMGILGLLFWIAFIAQFVLPLTKRLDRKLSISRLVNYLFGGHGPAAHIKDGKIVLHIGEEKRRGPGVILVDLNSAVVLAGKGKGSEPLQRILPRPLRRIYRLVSKRFRTPIKPTPVPSVRVEGPGVVFTNDGEKVRGVADLRSQVRQRTEVHGITIDGIEVTCNVTCGFTLGQSPEILRVAYDQERSSENIRVVYFRDKAASVLKDRRNQAKYLIVQKLNDELDEQDKAEIHRFVKVHLKGTQSVRSRLSVSEPGTTVPFKFDQRRVFSAIYSQAKDVDDGTYTDWTELPVFTAVEIFRNMLARIAYDALYLPDDPKEYPLQDFKTSFSRAVRNLGILAFQFVERADGQPISVGDELQENEMNVYPIQELRQPKVLRARGIKVNFASFSELKPVKETIRQRRLDTWGARWQQDAEIIKADHELQAMRIRNKARIQAMEDLVRTYTRILQTSSRSEEPLSSRILHTLETAATDPATRQLLPEDTINTLRNLRVWMLPEDDSRPPTPEREEDLSSQPIPGDLKNQEKDFTPDADNSK